MSEIQNSQPTGLAAFNQFLSGGNAQRYLQDVLGEKKSAFVNNVASLVANNIQLQNCEPMSVMMAALKCTTLDLPLDSNLGFCFVIPFLDRKNNRTVATFQIGKAGIMQLALRSGQINKINVRDVREGELIGEDFISGDLQFKKLDDDVRQDAKIIGFVAYLRLVNGFEKMLYMTVKEINAHGKKYSQTARKGYGLWVDNFEAMAEKTMLKRILTKYAPLSTEMKQAIQADYGVVSEKGIEYPDNDNTDLQQEQVDLAASIFDSAINEGNFDKEESFMAEPEAEKKSKK